MTTFRRVAAQAVATLAFLTAGAGGSEARTRPAGDVNGALQLPRGWRVERVVLLMRHGVRSPDRPPPRLAGMPRPWPSWPGEAGALTPRGAVAIEQLGAADRSWMAALGLLPGRGCPGDGEVTLLSNSFSRTIRTAEAYGSRIAPGCRIAVEHKPLGQPDPLFPSAAAGTLSIMPGEADAAARAAIGPAGLSGWDRRMQPMIRRLNTILCGPKTPDCGVRTPSSLERASSKQPPQLRGAIADAAEASAALLLQYADGWPASRVGWSEASAADVTALSTLVSEPFRITARPPYLASLVTPRLRQRMAQALGDRSPAKVTVVVGHDGTIASLAGELGLHWTVPGFATDYPAFGSGLGFARLRAPDGRSYVRAFYRGQSLERIRHLSTSRPGDLYIATLPLPCRRGPLPGACDASDFLATFTTPAGQVGVAVPNQPVRRGSAIPLRRGAI